MLSPDGRQLGGEDRLLAAPRRRRRGEVTPFAVRFHLAPAVEATTTADGQGALRIAPARRRRLAVPRPRRPAVDRGQPWIDGHARTPPTLQLVLAGETPPRA